MSTNKFINAYKNANREAVAESEDPQALIMVLLDELLRAMRAYVTIVEKQDDAKARKNDNLTRSLTIIYGLQSCLNFEEGGEIAENLFKLYEYSRIQLLNASATGETVGMNAAIQAISDIREAWSMMNLDVQEQSVG
uniref:Flagellar secretion chaperone FliS n=1 Tax=uncultured bacterium BAC17H8 TaxID=332980 RepID=Q4JMQ9_9BACT|nr:predicted flagellar protein [uncultured bacterium BAC17H8]